MCGLWVVAAVGCCKLNSMSPSGGSLENHHQREMQIVEGGPDDEISKGNNNSTRSWAKDHSSYILAKHLAAFCLCFEKLCVLLSSVSLENLLVQLYFLFPLCFVFY